MPLPPPKAHVVIVDDVAATRENLAKLLVLNQTVAVVGFAASGAEAITQVDEFQPDIVLLDLTLPDMTSKVVIETMINRAPKARLILMSNAGTAYYRTEPIPQAIYALLIKPITAKTFTKALQHARLSEG